MQIRELNIRNFRVFTDPPPIIFDQHFTVIAGINGHGKTAVLEGLATLFSRLLPSVSPTRSPPKTIYPSEINVDADFVELGMKVNCAGIPIQYKLAYSLQNQKLESTELPYAVKQEVRMAYGDASREGDAAPLAVYYSTDRAGYSLPKTLPAEVPRGQAAAYAGALFNRRINFRDFMARYRAMIELEAEQRSENPCYLGSRTVNGISAALQTFLGDFTNLRVQESPIRLLIDKGGQTLNLTQLSHGERSLLAMVCDLGRRLSLANPSLSNPLHGAGIVLIDELELHLHPKWQREVVEKLRITFPNIQFITTTHSPQIIGEIQPESLVLLRNENGRIVPHKGGQTYGLDSNYVLEYIMGAPSRSIPASEAIEKVEEALSEGRLDDSRRYLSDLRKLLHGEVPDVVRLEATINNLEALADEADTEER